MGAIDRYKMGFITALRSVGYSDEYAETLYMKMKSVNEDAPAHPTTSTMPKPNAHLVSAGYQKWKCSSCGSIFEGEPDPEASA